MFFANQGKRIKVIGDFSGLRAPKSLEALNWNPHSSNYRDGQIFYQLIKWELLNERRNKQRIWTC
jgi:hypothetical protein